VHRGEATPQALAEAPIERIDALNPQLNAVVERSFRAARSAALIVDLKAPLAGVAVSSPKDHQYRRSRACTSRRSCRWLAELPPAAGGRTLATRWRAAGTG